MTDLTMNPQDALQSAASLRGTALRLAQSAASLADPDQRAQREDLAKIMLVDAVGIELEHDLDADVRRAFGIYLDGLADEVEKGGEMRMYQAYANRLRRQASAMKTSADPDAESRDFEEHYLTLYAGAQSDGPILSDEDLEELMRRHEEEANGTELR